MAGEEWPSAEEDEGRSEASISPMKTIDVVDIGGVGGGIG